MVIDGDPAEIVRFDVQIDVGSFGFYELQHTKGLLGNLGPCDMNPRIST
jgi:hypothetical protein